MHGICTERKFLPYKSILWVISITSGTLSQFEPPIVLTEDGVEPKINFSQSWLILTYFLAFFLAPFSSPTALLQEEFALRFVYKRGTKSTASNSALSEYWHQPKQALYPQKVPRAPTIPIH